MQWIKLANAQAIADRAVEEVIHCAARAIKKHGKFKLVLAGGTTPALTYQLLAEQEIDFSDWQFFLGDERCLSVDHADRNSQLIFNTLINPAAISPDQFYAIPAEFGAGVGAKLYAEALKEQLPFDCVLLGLGEDGHTASLFPGHEHPAELISVPVHNAPKPPADRISLTAKALSTAESVLFLVSGPGKRTAVSQWKNGELIPAATVKGCASTLVLLDEAAAS